MKHVIKAIIAMAAFAALFVVPSIASAAPLLTHPTGTAPKGSHEGGHFTIQATNVAHSATEKVTKLTTPVGTIECTNATLTGSLLTNTGTKIQGEITTANFSGTPGTETSHCRGPFGGTITPTPSHTSNPCHTPTGGTEHCSLPWCVTAEGTKDKITIRGGKCEAAPKPITFQFHDTVIGTCSYSRESLTATYTTHPNAAIATVDAGQSFTKTTGSSFCPSSGELDMAYTLETEGPSPTDLYVD